MYEIFEKMCKEKGLTPYKVSQLTGIGRSTLSDWKKGKSTPKADKLAKIAELFDVPVSVFICGDSPTKIDTIALIGVPRSELDEIAKAYAEASPKTQEIIRQILEMDARKKDVG